MTDEISENMHHNSPESKQTVVYSHHQIKMKIFSVCDLRKAANIQMCEALSTKFVTISLKMIISWPVSVNQVMLDPQETS